MRTKLKPIFSQEKKKKKITHTFFRGSGTAFNFNTYAWCHSLPIVTILHCDPKQTRLLYISQKIQRADWSTVDTGVLINKA